eukprot:TRINITY_DN30557_c0_g1_i1.p1 TRINITY_DN30557_c0_g1~~TRINITY_DN30557_c0_g1_i1.p1  ORF type:complete len:393 (+),score=67.77 TRINITY_DN30557_c0_g1_i1:42-1220(+)
MLVFLLTASLGCDVREVLPGWGYEETSQWHTLHKRYEICGTGDMQSPIDLRTRDMERVGNEFLHFWIGTKAPKKAELAIKATGLEIELMELGMVAVGSLFREDMLLQKIIFKTPSEHTMEGQRFNVERQMWFIPKDKAYEEDGTKRRPEYHFSCKEDIVVVSDFFQNGTAMDPFIENLRPHLTAARDQNKEKMTMPAVAPDTYPGGDVYVYKGSLPYPPCTETVTWVISSKVLSVTQAQLGLVTSLTPNTVHQRPKRTTNGREVRVHKVYRPLRRGRFAELTTCNHRNPNCANTSKCPSGGFSPPQCTSQFSYSPAPPTPSPPVPVLSDSSEKLLTTVLVLATFLAVFMVSFMLVASSKMRIPLVDLPLHLLTKATTHQATAPISGKCAALT